MLFGWGRQRRREKLRAEPLPGTAVRILEGRVPYYGMLPPPDRARLHGHMQVFLAEKNFEGCGGLEMRDEIRVIVAAHACILELNRDTRYYPRLYSVLVYPYDFIVHGPVHDDGVLDVEGEEVRVGEAWSHGAVIFSWDGMVKGVMHDQDGYNVLFHEFAHQIDMENGEPDGYPPIRDAALRRDWAEVMPREFERLQVDVDRGRRTVLDEYGAEDPAEFFAVATETFFEASARLEQRHPELYGVLRRFYRQDPARLRRPPGGGRNAGRARR